MRRIFLHWVANTVALAVTAWLLPGVGITSAEALIVGAIALGLVNALVRPILTLLTLPLTFLSLGLFYLVVNAAAFGLTAWLVDGFTVAGFGSALLGALIASVVSAVVGHALHADEPTQHPPRSAQHQRHA